MTAPALSASDPFSIVEDAVWFALESYEPLAALVKRGNRVRLTGTKVNPIERSSSAGDFPELHVWPSGANIRGGQSVPRASDLRCWHQLYRIGIVSEHLRTNMPAGINVLKWHAYRALIRAEETLVSPSIPFVYAIEIGELMDGLQDVNAAMVERGIKGWKSLLDLEVRMRWSTAELRQ